MIDIDKLDKRCKKTTHLKRLAKDLSNIDLDFEYTSDFKNAKELRDFVEAISDAVWMPNKWKRRFVLITDEINNNAIEYWSRPEDKNRITIRMIKRKSLLDIFVEVEDSGKGKSPKTAKEMYEIKEKKLTSDFWPKTGIRGRWLFLIISNTVDKLYFEDWKNGGLIVWVEKRIDLTKEKTEEESPIHMKW